MRPSRTGASSTRRACRPGWRRTVPRTGGYVISDRQVPYQETRTSVSSRLSVPILRSFVDQNVALSYAATVYQTRLPIPDKLPLPLQVHRKQGEPCPRCGTTLEAVHYEDYVMCYCPADQTGGKVLKDRRLSRLLK